MIRFACFSTSATNLPMWYHYTNKRTGICLEYSTDDITDTYQRNSLFPVKYIDQLPDMTYMLAHRENPILAMPVFMTIHKLKDWSYENEWRILIKATDVSDIPMPRVSCVYLGASISDENRNAILQIAKEKNYKVKQMVVDRGAYALHAENVEF